MRLEEKNVSVRTFFLESLLVFCIFLILVIIFTFPLILNFNEEILGHPRLSGYVHLWQFWWTKTSVLSPELSLFWTKFLFHPYGVNTLIEYGNFLVPVLSIPFQMIFGIAGGYNAAILLCFSGTGLVTYLFCRRFLKYRVTCLTGAAIYTFLPYAWIEVYSGAVEISVLLFIPLVVLLLDKYIKKPTYLNAELLGAGMFFCSMSSWYYGFFMCVSAGLGFTVTLILNLSSGSSLKSFSRTYLLPFLVCMAVYSILMGPFIYVMGKTSRVNDDWAMRAEAKALAEKANPDILELSGPWQFPATEENTSFKPSDVVRYPFAIFPGFLATFLGFFGILNRKRIPFYFWVIGVFFWIISLGPWLKIGGTLNPLDFPFRIRLPLFFLATYWNAFAAVVAHSYRAFAIPGLLIAAVGASGLELIVEKAGIYINAKRYIIIISIGILLIVLFDGFDSAHLTYPMKTANINASELFQKLKNIQGLGAVINIPISPETHIVSRDMLEQIYHERPILGGRAYKPKSFIHDDPFLAKIVSITDKSGQILRTYEMNSKNIKNIEEINTLQLQEAGFRFFVVHWDWLNDDESQQIKSLLEKHCDLIEESREEQLSVYEIHK